VCGQQAVVEMEGMARFGDGRVLRRVTLREIQEEGKKETEYSEQVGWFVIPAKAGIRLPIFCDYPCVHDDDPLLRVSLSLAGRGLG
jgi:hypothetical protein